MDIHAIIYLYFQPLEVVSRYTAFHKFLWLKIAFLVYSKTKHLQIVILLPITVN